MSDSHSCTGTFTHGPGDDQIIMEVERTRMKPHEYVALARGGRLSKTDDLKFAEPARLAYLNRFHRDVSFSLFRALSHGY